MLRNASHQCGHVVLKKGKALRVGLSRRGVHKQTPPRHKSQDMDGSCRSGVNKRSTDISEPESVHLNLDYYVFRAYSSLPRLLAKLDRRCGRFRWRVNGLKLGSSLWCFWSGLPVSLTLCRQSEIVLAAR